jgi:tetratricopeptide (TPR) repeat protein
MIASVCAVLMLLAGAGAVFGWVNMRRARTAEIEAQTSRSNAEKLVSFLIEDFYSELEPTGRLDTLGKLAHMTIGYYDGLPPELVTPQTRIYRAMALVREGAALQSSGDITAAYRNFGEAEKIFEQLHAAGDHGEAVTYGLALTLTTQGYSTVGSSGGGRGSAAQLSQSADLLRPLVYGAGPSRRIRLLYADTLNILSHSQSPDKGVASCGEARKVLVTLGALQLSDLDATASYADTADSESRELLSLGRVGDARALEQQVYDLAEKVLAQRPGDLHALSDRSWAAELIGSIADRQHDLATADEYSRRAARAGEDEVRFNPSDMGAWQRWGSGLHQAADLQLERGEVTRSISSLRSLLTMEQDKRRPSDLGPNMWFVWLQLGQLQAQTGDSGAAAQSVKGFVHDTGVLIAPLDANDPRRQLLARPAQQMNARLELIAGQTQAAFNDSIAIISLLDAVKIVPPSRAELMQRAFLSGMLFTASHAAIRLGRYPQAEALARRWLALPPDLRSEDDPRIQTSQAAATLGHALALQGRNDEAQTALQPALAFYHQEQQAGALGTDFRQDFAYALYVSALAQADAAEGRAKRVADLGDAARLIDGSSAEAQQLASMREVAGLIVAARAK